MKITKLLLPESQPAHALLVRAKKVVLTYAQRVKTPAEFSVDGVTYENALGDVPPLEVGDVLVDEKGSFLVVEAAPDEIMKVSGDHELMQEAVYAFTARGIRVAPTEDGFAIMANDTFRSMLENVGLKTETVTEPFVPVALPQPHHGGCVCGCGHHHHEEDTCGCGHHHDHDDDDDEDEHEHHHDHDEDDDHDEHEHHHHDHDDHDHCCCGHHHDHDDDDDEHEHEHHHHDHDEHDHDHEEHENHHDHDGHCCCGHHHHDHHADEVFTSWGVETARKFTKAEVEHALTELDTGNYGMILRSKGIVDGGADGWLEFDYVPGEWEVRSRSADVGGKLVVIGSKLNETAIAQLFGC